MTFFDIARPLAERGVPQIRLRPKTKIALDTDWPNLATTDLEVLKKWSDEMPEANAASVARAQEDGFWFLDVDRPNFYKEIERQTGQKFPCTLTVRSSPGKGHFFFRQTTDSITMGNRQAADEKGELWSARVNLRYVVSPNSIHPVTGIKYEVVRDVPIIECPKWLIQWCSGQVISAPKKTDEVDETPITWELSQYYSF